MGSAIDLSTSVITSYWNYVMAHCGGYNVNELSKFLGDLKKDSTKYQYISEGDTTEDYITKVAMANAKMSDINSKSTDTAIDLEKTSNSISEIDISRRAGDFSEAIRFSKGNTSGFSGDMSKNDLIDLLRVNNSSNPERTAILDKLKKGKDLDLNEANILSDMISESNGVVNQSSINKLLKSVRVSTDNGRRKMIDMLDDYTDIKNKVTNIEFDNKVLVENNARNSIRERKDKLNKVLNSSQRLSGNRIDNAVSYYVDALIKKFDKKKNINSYSDLVESGLLDDAIPEAKKVLNRALKGNASGNGATTLNVPSLDYCMPIWKLIPDSFTQADFDILNDKNDKGGRKKKLVDSIINGLIGKSKDVNNPDASMDSVNTESEIELMVAAMSKWGKMESKAGAKELYTKTFNALKGNKLFQEMVSSGRIKVNNDNNTIEVVGANEDNTRILDIMQNGFGVIIGMLGESTLKYANDAAAPVINEISVMNVNNENYAVSGSDIDNDS